MRKIKPVDPETLRVPAFMRKRSITSHARQKLILTALDRKDAGLKPNSTVPMAPSKRTRMPVAPRKLAREAAMPKPELFPSPGVFPEPEIMTTPIIEEAPIAFNQTQKLMLTGEVTHYIDKINVAIILLSKSLKQGDTLLIEGENFIATQPIEEMQINRKPVARAKKGAEIGLKVKFEAKVGGRVYKV